MTRGSTTFLQAVLALIGLGVLAFLLWEPHVEGVNAQATTLREIYFDDPFLLYAYASSIPFFTALYHAWKLLSVIGRNNVFSVGAVHNLRTIKYCALATAALIVGGMAIILANHGDDDAAGAIAMGIVTTFSSVVVAVAAAVFENLLAKAVEMKTENDSTI